MASGKNRSSKNKSSKNKSSKNKSSKNRSSKYNASNNNVSKKDSSGNNTSIVMRVVIILFAVVLVVSLCLPFFSSCSSTSSTTDTTTSSTSDTTTTTTTSTADTSTVLGVQETYATLLESLENRVAEDPTNLANLVSLANNYMDCAFDMYEADDWATYEDDIIDLFSAAASYYALYLALAEGDESVSQDSINAVTVDEAVCRYYTGDTEQAIDIITTLLADQPHYAMGWYNLGAIYEQEGDYENAAEAYYTVLEVDPDDETGAYTNAYYQLLVMELNGLLDVEDTDEEETDIEDDEAAVDTESDEAAVGTESDEAVETDNDETADTDEYDTATE